MRDLLRYLVALTDVICPCTAAEAAWTARVARAQAETDAANARREAARREESRAAKRREREMRLE